MMDNQYRSGSLTLGATVALGTGVMIGAGIFALTGQVAELAGSLFPLAFLVAAVISAFSAYTYIKVSNKYPSAGGIAMILHKAYGQSTVTGAAALLMAMSMIINESLVARTFGTYSVQLFNNGQNTELVPVLAVLLIIMAFIVNIAGNQVIGAISKITSVLKVGGILAFSIIALWAVGVPEQIAVDSVDSSASIGGFIAALALAILAYKGFTTITNSGAEVVNPTKNVGRAIILSLLICLVVYMFVSFAVSAALTLPEIIVSKDYSLAEAARPAMGDAGVWFTVIIAIIATASGVLASVFAVSRMLAMLTDMKLIPHRHFGMPGTLQKHTLVYTVVVAGLLAALFDLSRIASLGAIFYLLMDIIIHWGVLRHLCNDVKARSNILLTAIILDVLVLTTFISIKGSQDPFIILIAIVGIGIIFGFERIYLSKVRKEMPHSDHVHHQH